MKLLVCVAVTLVASLTFAQDPTVPREAILSRLKLDQSTPAEQIPQQPALPVFKLKAIVLADDNSGNAIVEADERRFYLSLKRGDLTPGIVPQSTSWPHVGIQLGDRFYRLVDFSNRSIVLSNGTQRILVQ